MSAETLADILRDMRNPENDYITNNDLRDLADRIEAAAQREKVEAVTIAATKAVNLTNEKWRRDTGNATALREALVACFDFIMRLDRAFNPFMQHLLEDATAKASAAISATPRNCDWFRTADEAKAEWLRTNAKLLSSTGLMPFESWLLAPAEGREATNGNV